jgi:hypothetical protein
MAQFLRRVSAWTALITFSATFGLGWMVAGHEGLEDDTACKPAAVIDAHAHSSAQFESPRKSLGSHCPVCHLQRAVGGATPVSVQANIFTLEPVERVLTFGPRLPRSAALDAHLSRGPPSNS